jgi:HSP20 family protein
MMKLLTLLHQHRLALMILISVSLPLGMNGWSFGLLHPNPSSMSRPLKAGWILPTPRRTQKKRSSAIDRSFPNSSQSSTGSNSRLSPPPLFEITDDDHEFQIVMDIPGVKREDINVDLVLDDGAVLSISGLRLHKQVGKQVVFSQSFSLDPAVVAVDKITANLENGVLIVSAPKDMTRRQRIEENIRQKIPIQVFADKGDDSDDDHNAQENKATDGGGGGGAFDIRNEPSLRRPDPMEEEEEDLNAA